MAATTHIAGTIAQADNLGVFGSQGVFAATLWPLGNCPYILAGFRAFRGFDGATASFGDTSLMATSSKVQNVAVDASSDSTKPGRTVIRRHQPLHLASGDRYRLLLHPLQKRRRHSELRSWLLRR
jgi:hypothetical protein